MLLLEPADHRQHPGDGMHMMVRIEMRNFYSQGAGLPNLGIQFAKACGHQIPVALELADGARECPLLIQQSVSRQRRRIGEGLELGEIQMNAEACPRLVPVRKGRTFVAARAVGHERGTADPPMHQSFFDGLVHLLGEPKIIGIDDQALKAQVVVL